MRLWSRECGHGVLESEGEVQDVLHPWKSHGAAFMEPQERVQGMLERLWSSMDKVHKYGVLERLWNTRFEDRVQEMVCTECWRSCGAPWMRMGCRGHRHRLWERLSSTMNEVQEDDMHKIWRACRAPCLGTGCRRGCEMPWRRLGCRERGHGVLETLWSSICGAAQCRRSWKSHGTALREPQDGMQDLRCPSPCRGAVGLTLPRPPDHQ